ncbi:MAG: hypothetical protein US36_C0013G0008 [Candidatus Wolfebacteria bacterium GW2011_GWC1_37_10]|uniref:DedA family protein n=1 Tax=Candidatus Wolfebacteria bacterium GW2011_GWC1_37_10 TaxID=1619010 RepID=A0A0G0IC33_9BACT|nr:MAG: hypothetical protein US36_C0013G0008 [Candidatus Wolfebacteria bacterium GW2011_GWC1_37_10]
MIESFLINFSETHRLISYLIIFLAVLVEGEIILLLAGILSRNGYLDFYNAVMIAFFAAMIHDFLFWSLGKWLYKSGRKKFCFINLAKTAGFFERIKINDGLYIFSSKFAWSLNKVILAASGYLKFPFKELLRYSFLASLIWSIFFVSLGHTFAYQTDILRRDMKTALIFIIGFALIIVTLENILRKIIMRKI